MSLGYDPADNSTGDLSASVIGNLAAQRVLDARRDDGSNQENNYADTTNYQPVNTPDQLIDPNTGNRCAFLTARVATSCRNSQHRTGVGSDRSTSLQAANSATKSPAC